MALLTCARIVFGDGAVSASPAWVARRRRPHRRGRRRRTARRRGDRSSRIPTSCSRPRPSTCRSTASAPTDFATGSVDEIVAAVVGARRRRLRVRCLPTIVSAPLETYEPHARPPRATAQRPRAAASSASTSRARSSAARRVRIPSSSLRPVELEWLLALCDRFPGLDPDRHARAGGRSGPGGDPGAQRHAASSCRSVTAPRRTTRRGPRPTRAPGS